MPTFNQIFGPNQVDLSPGDGVRTGLSVADLKQSFLDDLFCGMGRVPMVATRASWPSLVRSSRLSGSRSIGNWKV